MAYPIPPFGYPSAAPPPGYTRYAHHHPAPMPIPSAPAPPPGIGMPYMPPPMPAVPPPPPGIQPLHPTAAAAAYQWMAAAYYAAQPGGPPPGIPHSLVRPPVPPPPQMQMQHVQHPPHPQPLPQPHGKPSHTEASAAEPHMRAVTPRPSGPALAHVAHPVPSADDPGQATAQQVAAADQPLDLYAPRFVPLWLRKVNERTDVACVSFHSIPPPDHRGYAQSFLPLPLLHSPHKRWLVAPDAYPDYGTLPQPTIEHDYCYDPRPSPPLTSGSTAAVITKPPGHSPKATPSPRVDTTDPYLSPLDPKNYAAQVEEAVRLEVAAREEELKQQFVYQTRLRPVGEKHDDVYEVSVPGLREERPRLTPGDIVQLRPVSAAGKFTWHVMFEAQIWYVDTFRGTVAIRAPGLGAYIWGAMHSVLAAPAAEGKADSQRPNSAVLSHRSLVEFNLLWKNPVRELASAPLGLSVLGAILEQDWAFQAMDDSSSEGNVSMAACLLHTWLFPTRATCAAATRRDERASIVDGFTEGGEEGVGVRFRDVRLSPQGYYDNNLNEEQIEAVEYLATYRPQLPFLIDGPPGTGKTKSMCEAVLQILLRQPKACVLLIAPSSTAADTLALRLSAILHPDTLFRLNPPGRSMASLPVELLSYSHLVEMGEGTVFGIPPVADLLHKRVVVSTTVDCELLFKSRCTNADLQLLRRHTLPLTHPREAETDAPLHWTHLLIDEAGQGTEAELATPLACVLPAPGSQRWPTLSLCGDVAQLGPRIQSSKAATMGLDLSLLERLLRRPVYQGALQQIREQQKRHVPPQRPRRRSQSDRAPSEAARLVCALRRNYRARHPALIAVPSILWYADALVPAAERSYALQAWPGFPNPKVPILFENLTDTEDEWVDEGVSWHNSKEADRVVELVQSLTGKGSVRAGEEWVKPEEIAVISPFREQIWRVRKRLRELGLAGVNVGSVEVYQGAERRVTIISPVRVRERFVPADMEKRMGLLFDRKRLCVATTRAQEALIVVGSLDLLASDPFWKEWILFASRHNCLCGPLPHGVDPEAPQMVSAIEASARDWRSDNPTFDSPDPFAEGLLAARMATATLLHDEED